MIELNNNNWKMRDWKSNEKMKKDWDDKKKKKMNELGDNNNNKKKMKELRN